MQAHCLLVQPTEPDLVLRVQRARACEEPEHDEAAPRALRVVERRRALRLRKQPAAPTARTRMLLTLTFITSLHSEVSSLV